MFAFCCYFVFVVKAIYKYCCGVNVLPFSSISCKVKSRTTHINCGRFDILSESILLTIFKTRLKVCNAF